ncbi:MAG: 50S ribosomal protein L4 [Christensenellales bacterium]|jgi:large subunit ribosomal protein L4|nr:50S ribosomal protein L4 [Clostridiales bacterium]
MLKVDIFDMKGNKSGSLDLNAEVFGKEYNEALIHQVLVAQLANKRQGTKSTLTRAEVRGGGIKPWRQKGTGRARQGSIRSPQWTKGGVVFAPKPRDFSKKVNKKMKDAALCSALSKKLSDGGIVVVKDLKLKEAKTKQIAEVLENLKVLSSALIVLNGENLNVIRASKNIPKVLTTDVKLINLYDLVKSDKCVITVDAIKSLMEAYA